MSFTLCNEDLWKSGDFDKQNLGRLQAKLLCDVKDGLGMDIYNSLDSIKYNFG